MIKFILKGALMVISDIIPGVSGGTIAFILWIYERLINSIKNLNISFLFSNRKENWNRMDLGFLIPLGIGIVAAFGIGSFIIPYLLENHPAYIFSFFFGLILGSIYLIKKRVKTIKLKYLGIGTIAFIFAFIFAGLETLSSSHSYIFIFFSGMAAIMAMLLPGISGSYVLLVLGQYKFMLEALKGLKIFYIISFILGALIGLILSSRIILYLLKRYHNLTIWALIGLMLGSLRVPFNNVVFVKILYPQLNFVWNLYSILLVGFFFLLGIIIVVLIGKFDKNTLK